MTSGSTKYDVVESNSHKTQRGVGASFDSTTSHISGNLARAESQEPPATGTADLPEAEFFTKRTMQRVLDVIEGRRSLAQVQRYLSPQVRHAVSRRAALVRRFQIKTRTVRLPTTIRSVAACHPADGVAEVSFTYSAEARIRAGAIRLESHNGMWRIVTMCLA